MAFGVHGLHIGDPHAFDADRIAERYLDEAARRGWEIVATLDTHLHADFVAGNLELRDRVADLAAAGGALLAVAGAAFLSSCMAFTGIPRALAEWIADPKNPLTARVAVNHIWMRHFHAPLVATVQDFGRNGAVPSHPELLDWLSSEFVRSGWSIKHLQRTILSSATYRQSSRVASQAGLADPLNKRLGRQRRLRVEAETVRDLAAAASGMLDHRIGGQSVYPPQPSGVYAFTQRRPSWPTSSPRSTSTSSRPRITPRSC